MDSSNPSYVLFLDLDLCQHVASISQIRRYLSFGLIVAKKQGQSLTL